MARSLRLLVGTPVLALTILGLSNCVDGQLPMANPFVSRNQPSPPAAVAAPTRAAAIQEGQRCGMALGFAVRCNLMRDDRDFAVLRFAVLQGLDRRYSSQLASSEMADVVDLATLDRITSIGMCEIPPADLARTEAGLRSVVDGCTGGS